MSDAELERFLKTNKTKVNQVIGQLPTHQQFLSQYCPAKAV